jgi:uncharacterized protein with HEPN domain
MSRDIQALVDVLNAAERVHQFSQGINKEDLLLNEEKLSAILYQISIIGEATKRLSLTFKQSHPEVLWRSLAGMRDVIVHHYDQLDLDIIWNVIQVEIPKLLPQLKTILNSKRPTDKDKS